VFSAVTALRSAAAMVAATARKRRRWRDGAMA
jgi:hypothetical protein